MIIINMISPLIASIVLIAISIFVVIRDWKTRSSRYYIYFNLSAVGILFTMFLTYAYPNRYDLLLLNKATQSFTIIFTASFLSLSMVFPKPEAKLSLLKIILFQIPAYLIGVLILFTDLTISKAYFQNNSLIREFKFYYLYYTIIVIIYMLAGVFFFIQKYIKTKIQIYKKQIRYVFFGVFLAVMFAIVSSIILPSIYNYSELYVIGPSAAAFISSICLFYAVIAYNLMGIRTAVLKTILHIAVSIIIIAPISVLIIFYHNKLWIFNETPPYLLAMIIVVLFMIISAAIQPLFDKIFRTQVNVFEGLLDDLIKEIAYIKNVEDIIIRIVDILYNSLSVKNSFAMLLNRKDKTFEKFYFKGQDPDIKSLDINSSVIQWFSRNTNVLNLDNILTDPDDYIEIKDDVINIFFRLNIKVILPVYNNKQIIGIICLGEKKSVSLYKLDEISKLQQFNNESNLRITNAIDYEEWNKGQFISGILDLSSEILSKAIPAALPKLANISFGAFYLPRYREGIDYFDFITPTNNGAGVIATEIAGRGINKAVYSVILRSAFHSCIEDIHSTFTTMEKLNKAMYLYTKGDGNTVKAYLFYYDITTMRLIYTNAGFQPLEIYRLDKNLYESLDTDGAPLGTDLKSNYGMGRTNLLMGDIGFLYSKALIDSKNQKGEKFGLGQLRNIIKESRAKHPSEITSILKDEFLSFMGQSSPESNILVIIFKV